ncbi:efflux RND transporter periplasmic adaptor subunit [Halomonas sp. 18H]|uniref:efflux RND transporter periplasmic adaptor subunit n=1 Tax=Halomonas almeriensis TaxID=308163 RepID=UPI00222E332C|nr:MULTISPECIES: efflux RND transporter periplasmic adaptor subunit [Halomonas]MCW4149192.1 efflux RND transporter periplasmic adaptor subunit [Halomonas sp. 18H]MDN3552258.1 efflux RND transporter periplasmic adaptor subunit [Halomonas almeriensis]
MKTMIHRARAGLLGLASGLLLVACGQGEETAQSSQQNAAAEAPPRPMPVQQMARQDLPLDKSYPSKLRSGEEVTLVARVTGFLEERRFEPGEMVEKGESLYAIEPDLYQATVAQRRADLESARAELARAQSDARRYEQLLSQNSVSRQQYDQALADRNVARASVAQAEAALSSAQLDLNYADVTAPVSGQIGLSQINLGNLVSPGTELATITPLDPLEVRFQMPQADAHALRQQVSDQSLKDIGASLSLPTGTSEQTLKGRLSFLGTRVGEDTGTVQAEASFANPDGTALPGQFARVSLEGVKRFDVLAVPEIAVTQGLMGPQVFVLDDDNVARSRTVQLGELAGPWQILRDGIEPGDRVVVGDPAGLQPGTSIDPQPFDGDAEALMEEPESSRAGAQGQSAQADATSGEGQARSGEQGSAPAEEGGQ